MYRLRKAHLYRLKQAHLYRLKKAHLYRLKKAQLYRLIKAHLYRLKKAHLYRFRKAHLYRLKQAHLYRIIKAHLYRLKKAHLYRDLASYTHEWASVFDMQWIEHVWTHALKQYHIRVSTTACVSCCMEVLQGGANSVTYSKPNPLVAVTKIRTGYTLSKCPITCFIEGSRVCICLTYYVWCWDPVCILSLQTLYLFIYLFYSVWNETIQIHTFHRFKNTNQQYQNRFLI